MTSACLSSMATDSTRCCLHLYGNIINRSIIINNIVCSSYRSKWLLPRLSCGANRCNSAASLSVLFSRRMRRACATSVREDQELEMSSDEEELQSEDEGGLSDSAEPVYPPPLNSKLYVGNLPWNCDSEELAQVFQKAGSVEMVEVIYDRMTGRSRGFGFVTMSTVEDAQAAIEKLDGSDYAGRILKVNFPLANRGDPPTPRPLRPDFSTNANRLFVGNIPWGVDDAKLKEAFSACGEVMDARVIMDRDTGRSRGFGFVVMSTEAEANEALNKMSGTELEGRSLRVSMATERPPARGDFL